MHDIFWWVDPGDKRRPLQWTKFPERLFGCALAETEIIFEGTCFPLPPKVRTPSPSRISSPRGCILLSLEPLPQSSDIQRQTTRLCPTVAVLTSLCSGLLFVRCYVLRFLSSRPHERQRTVATGELLSLQSTRRFAWMPSVPTSISTARSVWRSWGGQASRWMR